MKMRRLKKALSFFLCMALCVAMTLMTTGCSDKNSTVKAADKEAGEMTSMGDETGEKDTDSQEKQLDTGDQNLMNGTANQKGVVILGEGEKQFLFSVMDQEGNETSFEIHTNQKTVGEALLEVELIAGEDGPFGLYVKTVNGITLDYDKDKAYWAFYVNDAYAVSGVDLTEIAEEDSYSFRMEQ